MGSPGLHERELDATSCEKHSHQRKGGRGGLGVCAGELLQAGKWLLCDAAGDGSPALRDVLVHPRGGVGLSPELPKAHLEIQPLFHICMPIYIEIYVIFIGVQLIYNVVLVSGVQQSDSAIHIHICIYSFPDSFPL